MNDLFFRDGFFQKSNYIRIPLASEPARPSDEGDHKKQFHVKNSHIKKPSLMQRLLLFIIPSKVSRPYKIHRVLTGFCQLRIVADANLQVNVAIFRLQHILAVAGGIPP